MADSDTSITDNNPISSDSPSSDPPPPSSPSKRPLLPTEKTAVDDTPKKYSRKSTATGGGSPDLGLYSPLAGTSRRGSRLVSKFVKSGYATDSAVEELSVYAAYEFETCTFFQEIIPNLFLGRYPKHPFLIPFLISPFLCLLSYVPFLMSHFLCPVSYVPFLMSAYIPFLMSRFLYPLLISPFVIFRVLIYLVCCHWTWRH